MPTNAPPPEFKIVPIDAIHPHEEYDSQILLEITNSLRVEGKLHDPLLISSDNCVIMDGTHRYWALTRLHCRSVPVAIYSYSSEYVGIGCWYRCLDRMPDFEFSSILKGEVTSRERGLEALRERQSLLAIINMNHSFNVPSNNFNIFEAYSLLSLLECGLRGRHFDINYATERDALDLLDSGKIGAILAPPPILKEEVVRAATSGINFPIKSTRHIINPRPIGLDIPLKWLNDPLEDAETRLKELLMRGHFRVMPSGSKINGRRYEEEVYIFEPKPFEGDRDHGNLNKN
jgi:hypothetical protein